MESLDPWRHSRAFCFRWKVLERKFSIRKLESLLNLLYKRLQITTVVCSGLFSLKSEIPEHKQTYISITKNEQRQAKGISMYRMSLMLQFRCANFYSFCKQVSELLWPSSRNCLWKISHRNQEVLQVGWWLVKDFF